MDANEKSDSPSVDPLRSDQPIPADEPPAQQFDIIANNNPFATQMNEIATIASLMGSKSLQSFHAVSIALPIT